MFMTVSTYSKISRIKHQEPEAYVNPFCFSVIVYLCQNIVTLRLSKHATEVPKLTDLIYTWQPSETVLLQRDFFGVLE